MDGQLPKPGNNIEKHNLAQLEAEPSRNKAQIDFHIVIALLCLNVDEPCRESKCRGWTTAHVFPSGSLISKFNLSIFSM